MRANNYNKNGVNSVAVLPVTPHVAVPCASDLLADPEKYLKNIPKNERTNLYATLAHLDTNKKLSTRSWTHQDLLMFDIDNVDLENKHIYVSILAEVMKVDPEKIGVIVSGNGLHILIKLAKPFTSEFFKQYKKDYKAICDRVNKMISINGLAGFCDPAVFAPKRMFRVPLTTNEKPNKKPKPVEMLNYNVQPYTLNLRDISGLKIVDEKDQITDKQIAHIKVDTESVEAGCNFLKAIKEVKGNVSEPLWHATLSLTSRMKNPLEKSIEYSKGHKGFDPEQTKEKMERALKSSGPRTCESIDSLWGKCNKCPNFKKVKSPILLKNPDFIASDHVGFRIPNARGVLVAQHEDLLNYYMKKVPFKNINDMHYRYEGKFWKIRNKRYIESYAQEHFRPAPKAIERGEFRALVQCTNLDDMNFFDKAKAIGHLNCKNGVVNIENADLKPHCPSYGFRQILDFDYDPQATCPNFDTLMANVTCGDQGLENLLLEFFGYCLSGVSPAKTSKFLVLSGEGANGKSTLLEIFQALLGNSVSATDAKFMAGESSHFHMHNMCKALVNICEELPSGGRGAAEQWEAVKRIASGNPITAAEKGKTAYSIRPITKLIFTCNELPSGGKANHGWFRKMLIVPFDAFFSKERGNLDTGLTEKILQGEMSGVLNRCIAGYIRLKNQGYQFSSSARVDALHERFTEEKDSVKAFYKEALCIDPSVLDGREGEESDKVSQSSHSVLSIAEKAKRDVAEKLMVLDAKKGNIRRTYFGIEPEAEKPQVMVSNDDEVIRPIDLSSVPFMSQNAKGEYYIHKAKLYRVYAEYTRRQGGYELKNVKFYDRLADIILHDLRINFGVSIPKSRILFKGKRSMLDGCLIGTHQLRENGQPQVCLFGVLVRDDIDSEILKIPSESF